MSLSANFGSCELVTTFFKQSTVIFGEKDLIFCPVVGGDCVVGVVGVDTAGDDTAGAFSLITLLTILAKS
jgi:hypothetical protein